MYSSVARLKKISLEPDLIILTWEINLEILKIFIWYIF